MSDYLGMWLDILYTLYAISHVERLGQCCFCFPQELAYQIYLRLHMKLLSHGSIFEYIWSNGIANIHFYFALLGGKEGVKICQINSF